MHKFTKLLKTTGTPYKRKVRGLSPVVAHHDCDCDGGNCEGGWGACECDCDCADAP